MNIKFPKDKVVFIDLIKQLISSKNYKKLMLEYNNIISNSSFLNQYYPEILDTYFEILFDVKEYEKYITLVEELRKQEIENYMWYFYAFTILLYKKDLYYAKSLIIRSKILNDSSIKYLIQEDEGDYTQIINLHHSLQTTIGPCLVIINFINELLAEAYQNNMTDEYIIMRYFDLINLLFEYGINEEFITIFINAVETIYEIDIV